MSLLLNMLSRLVITILPRSKCLLISWLQSPSVVILEPRKDQLIQFMKINKHPTAVALEVMIPVFSLGSHHHYHHQHPTIVSVKFSSFQSLIPVRLFVTPWTAAHQASLSFTNSQSLLKLMSIETMMPSNHLILCRPLLFLLSIFPSIRVFSNESALCIRWPKYWSFSHSISPSNEYSGLISFRIDWFDLLAVQGTLKILLQQHSSKTSTL